MNPVTLDFVRRFRWVVLAQVAGTAIAWTMHGLYRGARLHFEMGVAMVLYWQLSQGLLRAHLSLPQSRAAVARGLWFAVVAVGWAAHCAGMFLGAGMASLLGRAVPSSVLTVHVLSSLLLAGTLQFLLTSMRNRHPGSIALSLACVLMGVLWGLSPWAFALSSFVTPDCFRDASALQISGMVVLAALTVASWFTTQEMVLQRAETRPGAAPAREPAGRTTLGGMTGWRRLVLQEFKWQVPVIGMAALAALFMTGIGMYSNPGVAAASRTPSNFHVSTGILAAMTMTPLFATLAGTLRVLRVMPVGITALSLLTALRPVFVCLQIGLLFIGAQNLFHGAAAMSLRDGWVFLLQGSLLSLAQAIAIRRPNFGVLITMAMTVTFVGTLSAQFMSGEAVAPWLPVFSTLLLALSVALHRRWLRRSTGLYRGQPWLQRITGVAAA